MPKNIEKSTLLISCTHGNEAFSLPIIKELAKQYRDVDYIIGNPRALKADVRYLETDLNRSGPGSRRSPNYEERRAKYIIEYASKYGEIIDIHGSGSDCGVFTIVTDPSWEKIELAKKLDIRNIVLWPGLLATGPLTQFIPNSVEIECGPKNEPDVAMELKRVLEKYLAGEPSQVDQSFYIVTGKVLGENDPTLTDFVEANKNGVKYYPLLSGNQYPGVTCYMMQKLGEQL